jgi:hypothetical protein
VNSLGISRKRLTTFRLRREGAPTPVRAAGAAGGTGGSSTGVADHRQEWLDRKGAYFDSLQKTEIESGDPPGKLKIEGNSGSQEKEEGRKSFQRRMWL